MTIVSPTLTLVAPMIVGVRWRLSHRWSSSCTVDHRRRAAMGLMTIVALPRRLSS